MEDKPGGSPDFSSLSSSILTDAKGMLQQNDNIISMTSASTNQHAPMDTDPSVADARSLLLHNDNILSGRLKTNASHTSGDKENYNNDMAKLQTAAKYCSISRECGSQHSSQNSQLSSYSHSQHTQHSVGFSASVSDGNRGDSQSNQVSHSISIYIIVLAHGTFPLTSFLFYVHLCYRF